MQPGQSASNPSATATAPAGDRSVSVEVAPSGANLLTPAPRPAAPATASGTSTVTRAPVSSGSRARLVALVVVLLMLVGFALAAGPLRVFSRDDAGGDGLQFAPANAAHNNPDIPDEPLRAPARADTENLTGLHPVGNRDVNAPPRPDPLRPIELPNTAETARMPELRFHSASGPSRALSVQAQGFGERRFNAARDNEIEHDGRTFRITSITARQVTLFEPASNQTFRIPVE